MSAIASATAGASASVNSTISKSASSLATGLPVSPAILANPASLSFNNGIFIAIYVLAGLTALTLAVGIAALTTQLVRKEQRRLVQKTVRSEGVYFLPHSPVLAPIMVICYAIVGLAALFVLKAFLWQGSAVTVTQRLSLLLPMPLLLFAWLSACANAFAWHLTPLGHSKYQHRLRLRPMTLNLITWITPMFIFAINLTLVMIWPMVQKDARMLKARLIALEAILPDGAEEVDVLALQYKRKLRQAEGLYQAVWAVWALAYGVCWLIYTVYSSLLIALLGRQMKFITTTTAIPTDPQQAGSNVSTPGDTPPHSTSGMPPDQSQNGTSHRRGQSGDRKSLGGSVKRGSTNTLRFIASVGPEMRYISKRELLRKNTRLVIMELATFSVFTIAWWCLSITKASMGYRILTNPITGPLTVIGELFESTLFALVVVSLLLSRGINILRNRKEQGTQGVVSTDSSGSQVDSRCPDGEDALRASKDPAEKDALAPNKPRNLAARRGKTLLAINLGSGTYFVPMSSSTATTPTDTPSRRGSTQVGMNTFPGDPSMQHFLDYSQTSPSSASSSAKAGNTEFAAPFGSLGPSSPTSEKLAELSQATRRKSSVTFADELPPNATSPHRSSIVHTPALEFIPASPSLPEVSLQGALATNWSESVRSLSKVRGSEGQ